MANRFYFRFLPLAIFDVSERSKGIGSMWSALIALGVALAIALPSIRARRVTGLELGVVAIFTLLTSFGILDTTGLRFEMYGRALAAGAFGVLALASLLLTPVSEPYTKDLVPRTQWARAAFKEVNLKVSAVWGFVFVAIALSDVFGALIRTPLAVTLGEWIAPIFLTVFGCSCTERFITREFDVDTAAVEIDLLSVD